MIQITKIFEFEASHRLPFHKGKCNKIHGHSYKLEVTVLGSINCDNTEPEYGMIIDFSKLKEIVEEVVINKYDHSNLNDFFSNPTAELMVEKMAKDINKKLPKEVIVTHCKLWETSTSYAEWSALKESDVMRLANCYYLNSGYSISSKTGQIHFDR